MAIIGNKEQEYVEPRLTLIAQADPVIWYKKPNLRFLYFILVPTALGVEWTSGFDSSMMNSLQAVESWVECKHHSTHGAVLHFSRNAAPRFSGVGPCSPPNVRSP